MIKILKSRINNPKPNTKSQKPKKTGRVYKNLIYIITDPLIKIMVSPLLQKEKVNKYDNNINL